MSEQFIFTFPKEPVVSFATSEYNDSERITSDITKKHYDLLVCEINRGIVKDKAVCKAYFPMFNRTYFRLIALR